MKNLKKTKTVRRCMAALLSGALVLGMGLSFPMAKAKAAENEGITLHNPVVEWNECDTVYFGHYWQEDTNGDGVADQKDEKTPIQWRILSREGNDAYVIADKVLDVKSYYEKDEYVTWETCTLRTWLNGEFYNTAFTSEEQGAILEQRLSNPDNETYGTAGGNDTADKVYLASLQDVVNAEYGFLSSGIEDPARRGTVTEYVSGQGMTDSWWWLRSPGSMTSRASFVDVHGIVYPNGHDVTYVSVGVRPALHINLSSPIVQVAEKKETSLKCVSWDIVELGHSGDDPIEWRVLEVSGDKAFLLSDRILEAKAYNDEYTSVMWKNCSLRNWLNEAFLNNTFSEPERAGILLWSYENEDNSLYGNNNVGECTQEKVTLLSLEDIVKREYGFLEVYSDVNPARVACGEEGLGENGYGSRWWLRTSAQTNYVSYVRDNGCVLRHSAYVYETSVGVRPALHISLSSLPKLTYAGTVTVCGDGTVTYQKPETSNTGAVEVETSRTEVPSTEATKPEVPTTEAPNTEVSAAEVPVPEAPNTEAPATEATNTDVPSDLKPNTEPSAKAHPTKLNISDKKTYKASKKVTVKDADGLKSVSLNKKLVKVKKGKKTISFRLSAYKKILKKKGKWNKLVVTDLTGKKKTIRFRIK